MPEKCTSETYAPKFESGVETHGEFGSQGVHPHRALTLDSANELSAILAAEGPKVPSVVVMAHPMQAGSSSGASKAVPHLLFIDGPVVNQEKRDEFLRAKLGFQRTYDGIVKGSKVDANKAGTLVNAGPYAAEWTQGNSGEVALRDATAQYQNDRKEQGFNESNL